MINNDNRNMWNLNDIHNFARNPPSDIQAIAVAICYGRNVNPWAMPLGSNMCEYQIVIADALCNEAIVGQWKASFNP